MENYFSEKHASGRTDTHAFPLLFQPNLKRRYAVVYPGRYSSWLAIKGWVFFFLGDFSNFFLLLSPLLVSYAYSGEWVNGKMLDPIKRVAAAAAGIIVVASEEAHFLLAQVFPYKNRTVFRAKKGGEL